MRHTEKKQQMADVSTNAPEKLRKDTFPDKHANENVKMTGGESLITRCWSETRTRKGRNTEGRRKIVQTQTYPQ